jgi:hypothetical protein
MQHRAGHAHELDLLGAITSESLKHAPRETELSSLLKAFRIQVALSLQAITQEDRQTMTVFLRLVDWVTYFVVPYLGTTGLETDNNYQPESPQPVQPRFRVKLGSAVKSSLHITPDARTLFSQEVIHSMILALSDFYLCFGDNDTISLHLATLFEKLGESILNTSFMAAASRLSTILLSKRISAWKGVFKYFLYLACHETADEQCGQGLRACLAAADEEGRADIGSLLVDILLLEAGTGKWTRIIQNDLTIAHLMERAINISGREGTDSSRKIYERKGLMCDILPESDDTGLISERSYHHVNECH